jgi:mono/diheme cytochrome c family protein
MSEPGQRSRGPLLATTLVLVVTYVLLVSVFPTVSAWIAGVEHPLPMPGFAFLIYFGLAAIGVAIYVTTSETLLRDFSEPIARFLTPGGSSSRRAVRSAALIALPLVGAGLTFSTLAPSSEPPTESRLQHPTIPRSFENLASAARHPSDDEVRAFQRANDRTGSSLAEARAEMVKANLEEGRVLYMLNCRPCHGTKADGAGPMARGFRLKPANFTDPGTIATLVEPYLLWRARTGGIGLPPVAAPWDSAMPRWENDLSDEQIWKIILAEYDIGAVEPRLPEGMD